MTADLMSLVAGHFTARPSFRVGQRVQIRFGGINTAPRLEPATVESVVFDSGRESVVVRRDDGRRFIASPASLLAVVTEGE
jgi:hypothetical protein